MTEIIDKLGKIEYIVEGVIGANTDGVFPTNPAMRWIGEVTNSRLISTHVNEDVRGLKAAAATNKLAIVNNVKTGNDISLEIEYAPQNWHLAKFASAVGGVISVKTVKFMLKKEGSPTGNAVAKIYAVTGVVGSTAVPTGSALATSANLDVSTLTTSFVLTTLTFSSIYTLTSGTAYAITLEYSGGDVDNAIAMLTDIPTPTHSGNAFTYNVGYVAESGRDIYFQLLDSSSNIVESYTVTMTEVDYLYSGLQTIVGQAFTAGGVGYAGLTPTDTLSSLSFGLIGQNAAGNQVFAKVSGGVIESLNVECGVDKKFKVTLRIPVKDIILATNDPWTTTYIGSGSHATALTTAPLTWDDITAITRGGAIVCSSLKWGIKNQLDKTKDPASTFITKVKSYTPTKRDITLSAKLLRTAQNDFSVSHHGYAAADFAIVVGGTTITFVGAKLPKELTEFADSGLSEFDADFAGITSITYSA